MDGQRDTAVRWVTASLLILIAGYAMCNNSMSVLMSRIVEDFSLAGARQGMMNSALNFGSIAAILLVPALQGRVKKSDMLIASALIQTIMLAITGLSPSFFPLLIACVFMGVGRGWADNYINSSIVDIHRENSAKYMGLLHGCYGIGSIFTPLMLQGLVFLGGWRGAYLSATGVMAIIAIQYVWVYRQNKNVFSSTINAEKKLNFEQVGQHLSDRQSLLIVFCAFLFVAGQSSLLSWLVHYMRTRYQAEALGAICVSIYWACATLSRFIAPHIRIASLRLICVSTLIAAAAHTVGVLSGNSTVMLIMTAINGLACGHGLPMLIHVGVSRHPGNTSMATSVIILSSKTAMMVTPLLVGYLFAISADVGMLLSSASHLAMVALTACMFLREEKNA